jgi:hypothetical protein
VGKISVRKYPINSAFLQKGQSGSASQVLIRNWPAMLILVMKKITISKKSAFTLDEGGVHKP